MGGGSVGDRAIQRGTSLPYRHYLTPGVTNLEHTSYLNALISMLSAVLSFSAAHHEVGTVVLCTLGLPQNPSGPATTVSSSISRHCNKLYF